jgi:hypothetical protein
MKFQDLNWWKTSNTLVIHTVANEDVLFDMYYQMLCAGFKVSAFCEPHLNYELTAIAVEPMGSKPEYMNLDYYRAPLLGRKESPHIKDEDLTQLVAKLEKSRQNDNQTIMEHGASIRDRAFSLIEMLYGVVRMNDADWTQVVPSSLLEGDFNEFIKDNLHDFKTIWNYTLFHDCGKPEAMTIDADGKRHFPDHEVLSAQVWSDIGTEDETRLMLLDMSLHRMKSEDFESFLNTTSKQDVVTLLIAAYAEIYANAVDNSPEGINSVSFKIKKKHLDRLVKKMIAFYM